MGNEVGQGHRTDRDGKKWGNTRKVSRDGTISVPSPSEHKGKSFEGVETKNALAFSVSGALVTGEGYRQGWEDIKNLAEMKLKEMPEPKKSSS
ncbi:hypothetical protein J4407_02595 [Candidatus Pacearchaeota archaeon]|nr:hypothetical protein [Candidatus Pacearchaeota archaeon]